MSHFLYAFVLLLAEFHVELHILGVLAGVEVVGQCHLVRLLRLYERDVGDGAVLLFTPS